MLRASRRGGRRRRSPASASVPAQGERVIAVLVRGLAGGAAVCPPLVGTLVPRVPAKSPAVGVDPAVRVRPQASRLGAWRFWDCTGPEAPARPGPRVQGPPDARRGLGRPWRCPGRLRGGGGGGRVVEDARRYLCWPWDPRALGAGVRRAPLGKVSLWPGTAGPGPSWERSGSAERDGA